MHVGLLATLRAMGRKKRARKRRAKKQQSAVAGRGANHQAAPKPAAPPSMVINADIQRLMEQLARGPENLPAVPEIPEIPQDWEEASEPGHGSCRACQGVKKYVMRCNDIHHANLLAVFLRANGAVPYTEKRRHRTTVCFDLKEEHWEILEPVWRLYFNKMRRAFREAYRALEDDLKAQTWPLKAEIKATQDHDLYQ